MQRSILTIVRQSVPVDMSNSGMIALAITMPMIDCLDQYSRTDSGNSVTNTGIITFVAKAIARNSSRNNCITSFSNAC